MIATTNTSFNPTTWRPEMHRTCLFFILVGALLAGAGCTPTVKVETPNEPITINMNIKIEHEIRVKVEKDLEDVFSEESGLF